MLFHSLKKLGCMCYIDRVYDVNRWYMLGSVHNYEHFWKRTNSTLGEWVSGVHSLLEKNQIVRNQHLILYKSFIVLISVRRKS